MKTIYISFVSIFLLICGAVFAGENTAVTQKLRSKYAMAQYHPECGGWYLIRYSRDKQLFYGFCDSKGNVIAQNATEYKLHKGYIELRILDMNQKQQHDKWEQQMVQYKKEYAQYDKVEGEYKNKLNDYNSRVKEAEKEAQQQYNQARDAAYKDYINRASAQMQQQALYNNAMATTSAGALGASIGNLVGTIVSASTMKKNAQAAADAVPYDPILKRVLAQKGLSTAPTKPYNPIPNRPVEPSSGLAWQTYPLLQPCPYSYIEYSAIQEVGGYADVKKDGEYGLVDASMKQIYPCNNTSSVKKGFLLDMQKVYVKGYYGLLNKKSVEVFKPIYDELVAVDNLIMAKKQGLWALYNLRGTALSKHVYSSYQVKGDNFLCEQDGKKVLINKTGKSLLPANLDKIEDVEDNLYCYQGAKVGLYTPTGKKIFPIEYSSMELVEDYFKVQKNNMYGLYTKNAKEIYPCVFQDLKLGSVGQQKVIYVKNNNKWGLWDFTSKDTILEMGFTDIAVREYGEKPYLQINREGKYGLCSASGLLLISCDYDKIEPTRLHNQIVFIAHKGEHVNLYDDMGMPMIPENKYTSFEWKMPFYYVKNGSLIGVVTKSGQEIVPCEYGSIELCVEDSCFIVTRDNTSTLVTMQGKTLFDPIPYRITKLDKNYIVIKDFSTNRMGLCSYTGRLFVPAKYKKPKMLTPAYAKYQKKNAPIAEENAPKLKLIRTDNQVMLQNEQVETTRKQTFTHLAQAYVEKAINAWQRQGEFEKTTTWQMRVNERTRAQRVYKLTKEAERLYIERETKMAKLDMQLQKYDPDNEVFLITDTTFGKMLVSVPLKEAEAFRANWQTMHRTPTYFIDNSQMAISKMVFELPSGKKYEYSNKKALNYDVADVTYNFDPIDLRTHISGTEYLKSIEIKTPFTMNESSSVLVSYKKEFKSFNMPDKDVTFPYALFRVRLIGDPNTIRIAKQTLRLYLGQMYATQAMVTNYSNQILFLIPVGVRHVYLDCGDGCPQQILFDGPLHYNKIYDGIVEIK